MTIAQKNLYHWYSKNQRPLPWREDQDPYKVWISETMLQQTTTTAVIPYFEFFLNRFPTLQDLAAADESEVLEAWAGLGYYSRARNLHRAAQQLAAMQAFPRSYKQLLELPGFGPYTSRAVASLAFNEAVGVLDGNVIRVLCRYQAQPVEWWKTSGRRALQKEADKWVQGFHPSVMNQALMELGATICLPQSPKCPSCPLLKQCQALKKQQTEVLPLSRPKKTTEIWLWKPEIHKKNGRLALVKNNYAPFLKNQWFLPGSAQAVRQKPKKYDFKHAITHHQIFIQIQSPDLKRLHQFSDIKWVRQDKLAKWAPASLVRKTLSL